uniref:Uncharacterized protein n=1 Tax=Anopheles dirus TaxID=7168 RepID=A0A182NUL1_9DIPT
EQRPQTVLFGEHLCRQCHSGRTEWKLPYWSILPTNAFSAMARANGVGGKYFLACLIGCLLIGATLGVPVPQLDDNSTEIIDLSTSSTTTEYPYAAIAKVFSSPPDRTGTIQYAAGRHKFNIAPNEDEQKRLLEEYYYHFERVEKNLPPHRIVHGADADTELVPATVETSAGGIV